MILAGFLEEHDRDNAVTGQSKSVHKSYFMTSQYHADRSRMDTVDQSLSARPLEL